MTEERAVYKAENDKWLGLHVSTMFVRAATMNRRDYCASRGWVVPADEDPDEPGYLIEDIEEQPNDCFKYVSWLPAHMFEATCHPDGAWTFGDAIELMKCGHRVRRAGWGDTYVYLVSSCAIDAGIEMLMGLGEEIANELRAINYMPHIVMRNGGYIAPWAPSQADLLSEDWGIFRHGP